MPARKMEGVFRHIDHIADVRDNHTLAFDRIADLAGHDQPVLGAFRMIMASVFRIDGRQVLFVPIDEVGCPSGIFDYPQGSLRLTQFQFPGEFVESHVRAVSFVELA